MTDENMTLLDAVESLQFIEMSAVSWINIIPIHTHYVAHFTIAFVLPFLEAKLPDEFRAGSPRFWPDQKRLLKSIIPINDQIQKLHRTGMLGDLATIYLPPMEGNTRELWTIETHAGSVQNRFRWIEAVIALEGRTPVRDVLPEY